MGEIETDKATMSFDATDDGYIAQILVDAQTPDVALGTPVLVMCQDEDEVAGFASFTAADAGNKGDVNDTVESTTEAPVAAPSATVSISAASPVGTSTTVPAGSRILASPLAKMLSKERGLDLSCMTNTGQGGRITKADVEAYSLALASAPAPAVAQPVTAESKVAESSAAVAVSGDFSDLPLSNVRKVIASRLLESKTTIPHYYLSVDVTVDELLKVREELNAVADGKYKLSVNDFVIKASALSMQHVPDVNSSWMDTFIRQHNTVDICVAVSTDNGLITPIVFDADKIGLSSISGNVRELAGRARGGTLTPPEYQGGTFTISNLGMFGVKNFSAIINPPQSCILAVGTSEKRVVVDESSDTGLGVGTVMSVTLSCDHRVVDGAVGAQWLQHFKNYLENPLKMLL